MRYLRGPQVLSKPLLMEAVFPHRIPLGGSGSNPKQSPERPLQLCFDQFLSSASQEDASLLSRAPGLVLGGTQAQLELFSCLTSLPTALSLLLMPLGHTSLLLFSAKARGTVLPQGLSICCSLSLNHFCSKWPQASLPLLRQILLKSHYTGELSLATLYKIAQQLPSPLPFPVSLTSLSFLYSI